MNDNNLYDKHTLLNEKRDSLEKFIDEQMIGPGGCGNRFGLDDLPENEEVINTTPGSIYSTAILFPKKSSKINTSDKNSDDEKEYTEQIENQVSAQNDIDNIAIALKEATDITDEEDGFSLERRFPNAIAISCALSEDTDISKEVKIKVSGRYYEKITNEKKREVKINIPESEIEILNNLFNKNINLKEWFKYEEKALKAIFKSDEQYIVKNGLKEVNKSCATSFEDEISNLVSIVNIKEDVRYLETYRQRLFSALRNHDNVTKQNSIINLIEKIGLYEKTLNYFDDLTQLYDSKSYGFWKSQFFEKDVDITNISFNKIIRSYKPEEYSSLNDIVSFIVKDGESKGKDSQASLSVFLQLISSNKNKNDKNKYLKVLLKNSSSDFIESDKNRFTIVNEALNKYCFFGVKIEIESDKLCPYRVSGSFSDFNKEEDNLNFIYRSINDYGIGHLCSVDWEKTNKPKRVWSEFIPTYDIPDVEYIPRNKYGDYIQENKNLVPQPLLDNSNKCLNLNWLSTFSDTTNSDISKALLKFIESYQNWINKLPMYNDNFNNYNVFAENIKQHCQNDCDRMKNNINYILDKEKNMESFRLMNSAMLMQFWHNKVNYSKIPKENITPDFYTNKGLDFNWRPFQLAFIILNLDGITQNPDDKEWNKRNKLVDLVWFPTGGGKTEAYFGIIALTIINRRRNNGKEGGGVTAFMRYTLRLLATQQFQRAMKMILALDQIRQWGINNNSKVYNIGTEIVSIGLYVGSSSLPNKYDELNKQGGEWNEGKQTNIPLKKKDGCPWCGKILNWGDQDGIKNHFHCTNPVCPFYKILPIQLCDELIYEHTPTFLFGTVDKFAQLAHKVSSNDKTCDSRRLFGVGSNIDYLTPDLIIQDELHLLLGPLGSAVSLFESAIDQLCRRNIYVDGKKVTIRPKIISSTATTRNTELQIRALYDRDVNVFPNNGVDYDDSFFAFYKRKRVGNDNIWVSKRKYMGILPTGRTQMLTQIRLAAILFIHRAIFEKNSWLSGQNDDAYSYVADNYYSAISYFNSLKEVGKTDAQFSYEFPKYIQRLYHRTLGKGGILECFYSNENLLKKSELTGRLSGIEIINKTEEVENNFDVKKRLPYIDDNEDIQNSKLPPDYILATNMISVGLDISRFNTMIINSMPRNNAEYIQASSRVARSEKGLVITSHNPFRARDVSHYEKFIEFHEKLYFYVEPISITPFSRKSINKYLPLSLATIIRHKEVNLQNPRQAIDITKKDLIELKKNLMEYFNERYDNTNMLTDEVLKELFRKTELNYIDNFIKDALDQWLELAKKTIEEVKNLVYEENTYSKKTGNHLFVNTEDYDDDKNESMWIVPNSLRIVEQEAVLKIKNFY